ncbi:TatD family hydrolase [Celerinatantimonas sp. YJH-8]|uniref:TatD family hydrolase n=1 Tax=Celerinatantimonas sp. YJH-8 TaxID=3228714 RepID=UPI0038C7E69B
MIDIALNLSSGQFATDRDQVMSRAYQAGVKQFLLLASDASEARVVAQLAEKYQGCVATAGCHPHQAGEWQDQDLAMVAELSQLSQVVAIGECGLDYNRNYSPVAIQKRVFERQLELAAELGLPVLLHERDAHEDFMLILSRWLPRLKSAVLHCFTGDKQALIRYLEAGLYIGLTGWICDERRGQMQRSLVADIPTDRLFLETDAPYLLPRDLPNKPGNRRNEPCYLPHIYQTVADLKGLPMAQLEQQISQNFQRVFFA